MALAALQRAVLASLSTALQADGFRLWEQDLWRPKADVRQIVHVSFIRHADDLDLTLDVAVRHNEIEDRLAKVSRLPARQKRRTATVGVELGNLADGRQKRWRLTEPSDVTGVVADALAWIRRFGLPFLDRFSSLDEIVAVLQSSSREALLICPIAARRELVLSVAKAIQSERAA